MANPLSVIEQLTYLLFIKRLDELHTLKERKAARTGKPIEDPVFAADQDNLRWTRFKETAGADVAVFGGLGKHIQAVGSGMRQPVLAPMAASLAFERHEFGT